MTNILKVTTPVSGYEKTAPVKNKGLRNTENTAEAVSKDEKGAPLEQDKALGEGSVSKFRYESNYGNFIKQLHESPSLTESLTKVFDSLNSQDIGNSPAEFIAMTEEFVNALTDSPEERLAQLKGNAQTSIRFSGAFFGILRQVLNGEEPLELKAGVLEFLRRYTDMAETPRLLESIRYTLASIDKWMYKDAKMQLAELTSGLTFGKDEMASELQVLRDKVLPFLNLYISRMNERGSLRDLSALLGNLLGRCENGAPTRVEEAFAELMKFQGMQKYLAGANPSAILQVLANSDYEKAKKEQKWVEKFRQLVSAGVTGKAGKEQQQMYKDILQAMIVNESVYMPILHTLIPYQADGKVRFSEMWVDPDADKTSEESPGKRGSKCLVKFDIDQLGKFDLFLYHQDGKVKMQLNAPEKVKDKLETVRTDLTKLITKNGLEAEELYVETGKPAIPLTEAFPQIMEKENSVNVRI
ncbi:hypothetical protein M2145_000473 [Lachnospiraceae bacterium PF1-21]|nr:hypothetical protein [Lachnospiraceae bacterium OttesenSCG-928-J05]